MYVQEVSACNCSLSTQIFDEIEVLFQDSYLNELLIIADYLYYYIDLMQLCHLHDNTQK